MLSDKGENITSMSSTLCVRVGFSEVQFLLFAEGVFLRNPLFMLLSCFLYPLGNSADVNIAKTSSFLTYSYVKEIFQGFICPGCPLLVLLSGHQRSGNPHTGKVWGLQGWFLSSQSQLMGIKLRVCILD